MQSDPATVVTVDPTRVGTLYTTGEVAKLLRVHPRTIQEWIRERDAHGRALRQALYGFARPISRRSGRS